MELQGCGAAHIHGLAWCNLKKVSSGMKRNIYYADRTNEFEDNTNDEFSTISDNIIRDDSAMDTELEKAFIQLRMGGGW